MAYSAADIAGVLKGTHTDSGAHYVSDVVILTAIALAQQADGQAAGEGWWGTHQTDLKGAAGVLLVLHQQSSLPKGGDPPYATAAYTSGRYAAYLPAATAAAATAPAVDNSAPLATPPDHSVGAAIGQATGLTSALDFLGWFTVPHNWLRVIYGVSGVAVIFLGLSIMFRPKVEQIARAATSVAEMGAVA